jgi:hypothetical protein
MPGSGHTAGPRQSSQWCSPRSASRDSSCRSAMRTCHSPCGSSDGPWWASLLRCVPTCLPTLVNVPCRHPSDGDATVAAEWPRSFIQRLQGPPAGVVTCKSHPARARTGRGGPRRLDRCVTRRCSLLSIWYPTPVGANARLSHLGDPSRDLVAWTGYLAPGASSNARLAHLPWSAGVLMRARPVR